MKSREVCEYIMRAWRGGARRSCREIAMLLRCFGIAGESFKTAPGALELEFGAGIRGCSVRAGGARRLKCRECGGAEIASESMVFRRSWLLIN